MAEYGAYIDQSVEDAARSKVRRAAQVKLGCMLTVEEAEALGMDTDSSKRILSSARASEIVESWSNAS